MSLHYGLFELVGRDTPIEVFVLNFVPTVVAIFYVIFCIVKFGQTIGKFAMGVKIYQLDERTVIGYKRAFLREAVPIVVNLITPVAYYVDWPIDAVGEWITFVWVIVVGITMFTDPRRRGINDVLASSIAIDVDEQQREIKEPATQRKVF